MPESIKGLCPGCGKPLEIPAELTEFSCLYCGRRYPIGVLRKESHNAEQYPALREALRAELPLMVTPYSDYFQKITRKDFFPAFERYENENSERLERLQACVDAHPEGAEAGVREICADLIAELDRDFSQKPQRKKEKAQFETRVVLAVFLTPLIRKRGLDCAEGFCTQLHSQWLARYPKQPWTPGDYEVLVNGFRRRKWCFITTATCRYEGKPDDCAELTAFRAFRDGWLMAHGGEALIAEYYEKAPGIVACIELCDCPQERYEEIQSRWLTPCYQALTQQRYADCRDCYIDMVRSLEQRYAQG